MKYDQQAKIGSMILLVAGSILLTFYFHRHVGTGTVFTHLFYIPIILGALWWGRPGIAVALIMSAVVILTHRWVRAEYSDLNDSFRAVMFIVVSIVVVILKERMVRAESAQQKQEAELRSRLENLVQERTEELVMVNRQLREEIVQREQTETSLRESEHQYRLLFENATEAIYIAGGGMLIFANPALTTLTGYDMPSLLEHPFVDLIYAEDQELVTERYRKRIAGEAVPGAYSFRIVNAGGEIRWVEINTVLIQWQGQAATLNFLRDITDRKKMEASINQIQKMEAIGALAGGIAHQFNNALSGITGYIDLLRLAIPDNRDAGRYCEAMLKSAHAMTGLTHQLLSYARGGRYQPRPLALNALVRDVLPLMTSSDEKQIRMETALSSQTPRVEADAVQMQMVLSAVINNGAEAIDKKGWIRIETFLARIDRAASEAFEGLPPGDYAGLSITDSGKGMSEGVRKRIFEPFFTTHFPGRGMGMAAAYGIVKHHGGYIYVDSEVGRGAVVHILLPPCQESVKPGTVEPVAVVPERAGGLEAQA